MIATMTDTLEALDRDGIVSSSAAELVGATLWGELREAAAEALTESAWLVDLARRGQLPTTKRVHKPYLVRLLGDWPDYDSTSVWARVANATPILDLARTYLGAPPSLNAFNLWLTVPSHQPPTDSQLWHRDVDAPSIFKVFFYLSDVTPEAGPLTYLPRTHRWTAHGIEPETTRVCNVPRATDAQMRAVAPTETWREATGPLGTALLVDTSGWHKGGHGTIDRLVFTAMYTTVADLGYFAR